MNDYKYKIAIRNNGTGEIRFYIDDKYEYDDFIWTEGNYACDCNRALFWSRAGGEDDLEADCGDKKFSALYAEFPDGRKIKVDDDIK